LIMEDTCNPKCHKWKKFKKNCPFYLETTWIKAGENVPRLVRDCAPKRTVFMLMDLIPRVDASQRASEQARNGASAIVAELAGLAGGKQIPEIGP